MMMMKKGPPHTKDSLRAYQPGCTSSREKADLDITRGKRGLFKRWGGNRKLIGTDKDALSTEAVDGSNEGSSAGSSHCSEHTQKTCNHNSNSNSNNNNWVMDAKVDIHYTPTSPTTTMEKKPQAATSICSGHSSPQSDSPIGVDQFPIPYEDEEEGAADSDDDSENTLKTKTTRRSGGRSVSNYFDASVAVMPLPFGQEDKWAPEVTRQTSKQYKPLLPHQTPQDRSTSTTTATTSSSSAVPVPVRAGSNAAPQATTTSEGSPPSPPQSHHQTIVKPSDQLQQPHELEHQQQQQSLQRQDSPRERERDLNALSAVAPAPTPPLQRKDLVELDQISPGTSRRRNSLEDVLRGEGQVTIGDRPPRRATLPSLPFCREPTVIESIQEEEEFYARGRAMLREPIIPREAYIDPDQRSLSPPTIDTRLQSTVDSRRTFDTRLQSTVDTRSTKSSRMHFSIQSRMSANTPKVLPEDPNATIFIPIQPGIKVPLRRCPEVQSALETEFYDTPSCPCCSRQLAVIADSAFLYCPICHEISPLFGNICAVGKYPQEPEYLRFGLGLGMTWETMKKVYAEMYPHDD